MAKKRTTKRRKAHVELYRDVGRHWRYRVRAANGEVTEASEAYYSRSNALRAANAVAMRGGMVVKVLGPLVPVG